MSPVLIIGFLKAILPTKKITAWILGVIAAALALMGVNNGQGSLQRRCCRIANKVIEQPAAPEEKKIKQCKH
jgi:hypothetical protein